jgi:hypothetical protein
MVEREEDAPAPRAQLIITLDHAGNIGVTGPITDKVLCYGMLGVAHDAIRDYNEEKARRIVPASTEELSALVQ